MYQTENLQLAIWATLIGLLLIAMALSNSLLKRLPLSGAIIYLLVGVGLGSSGWRLFDPNPYVHAAVLERVAEGALLISLFSAGLKLRLPITDPRWRLSVRLATVTMLVTILLTTMIGLLLGLPIGVAILLGAILAPTDPVLASDVQVENASDKDKLRFCLTGESGLNDGVTFPFVILGISLLPGTPSIDLTRWLAWDVAWSVGVGIGIGVVLGALVGRLVLYLRTERKEAVGLDEFLVLGLIAIAYGGAIFFKASTFLAVFAAALAVSRTSTERRPPRLPSYELEKLSDLATDPEHAGPLMMQALIGFNEQLERIAEVTIVILTGAMLPYIRLDITALTIAPALILIIRPLAVTVGLLGVRIDRAQRVLISWFGIRGVGSFFYVLYVINHSSSLSYVPLLLSTTLATMAASIFAHGISVTPLMKHYTNRQ